MNATQSPLVLETLDCLMAIAASDLAPADASQRLRGVREAFPDIKLDLLWDQGDAGPTWHYDALLRLPKGGTISLSYCPDRATPWPMRGARRFGEADLLRVNDIALTVGEAIGQIDSALEDRVISARLIDSCLILEELVRDPVEVSNSELQRAMDAFRRTHRLYTVDACQRWMARRGLSHAQFERLVADQAAVAVLRRRVTADRVPAFFDAHREAFDTARLAQIQYEDRESAERVCTDLVSCAVGFFNAAQARFAAGPNASDATCSMFRAVQRGLEPSALAEAVFAAESGTVLGPIESDAGFLVVRIMSIIPAQLDDGTREQIQRLLFDHWLDERRQQAQVEWFWHNED